MEYHFETVGDVTKVSLEGRLVAFCSEEFKEAMFEHLKDHKSVLFDLTRMVHVDSSGLGVLVTILQRFYANINDAGWWGSTVSGVKNALTNADDYITSLRWYPCYIPISVSLNRIKLGSFDTGVDAYILTGDPQVVTREVTIMRHPQAATRGAYLNYAPYSRYEIVDPLVGVIPVSSDIAKVIKDYIYRIII